MDGCASRAPLVRCGSIRWPVGSDSLLSQTVSISKVSNSGLSGRSGSTRHARSKRSACSRSSARMLSYARARGRVGHCKAEHRCIGRCRHARRDVHGMRSTGAWHPESTPMHANHHEFWVVAGTTAPLLLLAHVVTMGRMVRARTKPAPKRALLDAKSLVIGASAVSQLSAMLCLGALLQGLLSLAAEHDVGAPSVSTTFLMIAAVGVVGNTMYETLARVLGADIPD